MGYVRKYYEFLNESLSDVIDLKIDELKDRLLELNDLGYRNDESKFSIDYIESDGSRAHKNTADMFIINWTILKKIDDYLDVKIKINDQLIETFELINKLTLIYHKVYFDLDVDRYNDELKINLSIVENIDKELQKKDIEQEKINNTIHAIKNRIDKFYNDVEKELTEKIKRYAFRNLQGESNYSIIGKVEDGFVFRPFNTKDVSKSVVNLNVNKINNISLPYFIDREIREINSEDIDRVAKSMELDNNSKSNLEKRYLGLKAVILKFDYKKLYDYYMD